MGWGGRGEGASGWGTHVLPWLIHVNVWQNPPQYCKVISLQLKLKKKKVDCEGKTQEEILVIGHQSVGMVCVTLTFMPFSLLNGFLLVFRRSLGSAILRPQPAEPHLPFQTLF